MLRAKAAAISIAILLVTCVNTIAATPLEDFDEAVRLDLRGQSRLAFATYLRAANAGLAQAQFNVAVMLDSGRGVERNMKDAALWYARAAARGSRRAAYNLGELYESGDGVPQNLTMAHSWFLASGLPASATHHFETQGGISRFTFSFADPEMMYPAQGSTIYPEIGGISLVWACKSQPVPVVFYIELRRQEPDGYQEVFSGTVEVSSVFVALPKQSGSFAWRVTTISKSDRKYAVSDWGRFTLLPYQR